MYCFRYTFYKCAVYTSFEQGVSIDLQDGPIFNIPEWWNVFKYLDKQIFIKHIYIQKPFCVSMNFDSSGDIIF